jgi:hypothetical protein
MPDNFERVDSIKYTKLRKIRLKLLLEERLIFGNLNSVVIFQILGVEYWSRQIENAENLGLSVPDMQDGHPKYTHHLGLSAQSITDISQMPRTTVLRALTHLMTLDFVVKTSVGYYINPTKTRTDCYHVYADWYLATLKLLK